MSDIKWLPDGQKAFDKILAAIPDEMRDTIKPKLLQMLAGKAAGAPVSRELVEQWVSEDLPEPQRSALMAALGLKKEGGEDAAGSTAQAAAEWEGQAEEMFEIMLGEVPDMMREVFRGKLMGIATEKAQGGAITEDHITQIVQEIVPDPFKTQILKKFATMGGVDLTATEAVIEATPDGQDKVFTILHAVQDEFGYIPREALVLISQRKDIPLSVLYRLVTSYAAFSTEAPKEHVVEVCCGTGCQVMGGGAMLQAVEAKAAAGANVTVQKVRCLGCCNVSPAVKIDGELVSGVQAQARLEQLLSE